MRNNKQETLVTNYFKIAFDDSYVCGFLILLSTNQTGLSIERKRINKIDEISEFDVEKKKLPTNSKIILKRKKNYSSNRI